MKISQATSEPLNEKSYGKRTNHKFLFAPNITHFGTPKHHGIFFSLRGLPSLWRGSLASSNPSSLRWLIRSLTATNMQKLLSSRPISEKFRSAVAAYCGLGQLRSQKLSPRADVNVEAVETL